MTSALSDMTMSSTTLINLNSTSNTVPQQYGSAMDDRLYGTLRYLKRPNGVMKVVSV